MCYYLTYFLFFVVVEGSRRFYTVGYLPEWRYEGANWNTLTSHLTHVLLFSGEPTEDGGLTGLDRFPREELLNEARDSALKNGAQLLLCFGGNGRSSGFSAMVRNKSNRARFVASARDLVNRLQVDGLDLNWEYPGYSFGSGYQVDADVEKDYKGLGSLARELRKALPGKTLTMAYYPDGRQEAMLIKHGISKTVDLMHAMTYDQNGGHHSTFEFAEKAMDGAAASGLPLHKVTLGLPFYGRSSTTGDWTTFEDLVQRHAPLDPSLDTVPAKKGETGYIGFNGRATIAAKTRAAMERGLGGVMIWEAGQDCRVFAVTHGDKTHGVTCPNGKQSSLLEAMTEAIQSFGNSRGDL